MPLLQTLIHISTILFLPSNLFTCSEMRLEDISLLDPTTKLHLSGSLNYPLLNINQVSSERNVSRKECENFRSHFAKNIKIFSRNFVKTMSFIAAQMNCSEELQEFSDFILCFKKKILNGRERIFNKIYELSDVSQSFLNLY